MKSNPNSMGPYAYKNNQWVSYDDIDIVRKKAKYAADNKLGGIMFWSIDNDDFRGDCHSKAFPLIEAGKDAFLNEISKKLVYLLKIITVPLNVNRMRFYSVSKNQRLHNNRKESQLNSNRRKTYMSDDAVENSITKKRKPSRNRPRKERTKSTSTSTTTTTIRTTSTTPAYITPEPPITPESETSNYCWVMSSFFQHFFKSFSNKIDSTLLIKKP